MPDPGRSRWELIELGSVLRHDPINASTMGGIVRDAKLTVEQFRGLL